MNDGPRDGSARYDSADHDRADHDSAGREPESPMDALFGEAQFRNYDEPKITDSAALTVAFFPDAPTELMQLPPAAAALTAAWPTAAPAAATAAEPAPAPAGTSASSGISTRQKAMFAVAAGVITLLALAVPFLLGIRLAPPAVATTAIVTPALTAPSATPTPTTPSATPTPPATTAGPAAVGSRIWSDLRGGECVEGFEGPFAQRFNVVECAGPHAAQLVLRGTFRDKPSAAYPGLQSLAAQSAQLCTATGVVDLTGAGAYTDLQMQSAYPATAQQWTEIQRDYFCFVNRSGGAPITGTVAGAVAAIEPE